LAVVRAEGPPPSLSMVDPTELRVGITCPRYLGVDDFGRIWDTPFCFFGILERGLLA